MTNKRETARIHSSSTVRTSVSFPEDLYVKIEKIANRKKVSVAWVIRDAVEKYAIEGRDLGKRDK